MTESAECITSRPNGYVDEHDLSEQDTLQFVRSDFLLHAAGLLDSPALPDLAPPQLTKPAAVVAAENLVSSEQLDGSNARHRAISSPDLHAEILEHLSEGSQRELIQQFGEANTEAIRRNSSVLESARGSGQSRSGMLRLALRDRIAATAKDGSDSDVSEPEDESLVALAAASFTAVGHDELGLSAVALPETVANDTDDLAAEYEPQFLEPSSTPSGADAASADAASADGSSADPSCKAPVPPAPVGRVRSWVRAYGAVAASVCGLIFAVEAAALVAFYATTPMAALTSAPRDSSPVPTQQVVESKPAPSVFVPTTRAPVVPILTVQSEPAELSEEAPRVTPQAAVVVEAPAAVAAAPTPAPRIVRGNWRPRVLPAAKPKSDGPMIPSGI